MVPRGKYTKIMWSHIIGYVDHLDVVHSRCFNILDDDYQTPTHYDLFGVVLKGWRWDYDKGLNSTDRLDPEDYDRIRDHLTDVYDIPFYENGYHDVMFICEMVDKEEKENPDEV